MIFLNLILFINVFPSSVMLYREIFIYFYLFDLVGRHA